MLANGVAMVYGSQAILCPIWLLIRFNSFMADEMSALLERVRARNLRILITNDDGIHAPGFEAMTEIAQALSDDVWAIAPENEQSGASHSLTLHEPLRLRELAPRRFAVLGTPTDCVMMGVKHVIPRFGATEGDAKKPDLVLSGVNRGANMADDVTYSGTVAGAMEGTTLGIPSIALSQAFGFRSTNTVPWDVVTTHAPPLVAKLLDDGWPKDVLVNINFPDVPPSQVEEVEVTIQGRRDDHNTVIDERQDARGVPYYWLGFERRLSNPPRGTDLRAIYDGHISVTPLHLNLTHADAMADLAGAVAGDPATLK